MIRVSQFITFFVLARVLGPEDFGWFGVITTAFTLVAMLGSLGLRQSFAYWLGQGRITPAQAIGTGLVVWPLVGLISGSVVALLYAQSLPGTSLSTAILLLISGSAIMIALTLVQGIFLGVGDIKRFTLSESIGPITMTAVVCLIAVFRVDSLVVTIAAHVGSIAVSVVVVTTLVSIGSGRPRSGLRELPAMLRYGLIFAANLFFINLCTRASMFIIQYFDGAEGAGYFFAAVRVNEIFLEIASALGMVLFSQTARQRAARDDIVKSVTLAGGFFVLFFLLAALVALAAPLLVSVALGEEFSDSIVLLQIMAIGLAPAAGSKIVYPVYAGAGKPAFGTIVIIISLLVNVAVAILLVPFAGIVGGAVALVAGQYVMYVGHAIVGSRKFGVPFSRFIFPPKQVLVSAGKSISRSVVALWKRRRNKRSKDDG